jgi:hypothetical protein
MNCNCNRKENGGSMKKMIVSLMLILSMFAFAAESAPSATVGYVKYTNVLNATLSDLNQIALPLQNSWTTTALIDPTAAYINSIQKWNPTTQAYNNSYFSLGSWKNVYAITTGDALTVNEKTATNDLIVSGSVVTVPAYNLIVNAAAADLNHIMLPMSKAALSTTALLGADLGTGATVVNSIQKWNNLTQAYNNSYYSLGSWKNVYATAVGDPLMLNMVSATTWPVGGGKDGAIGTDWANDSAPKAGSRVIMTLITNDLGAFYAFESTGDHSIVSWKANIVARPTEVIRDSGPATYVFEDIAVDGRLSIIVDPQYFATPWLAGDVLRTLVRDEATDKEAIYDFTLDASNDPTMFGYDDTYGPGNDYAGAFHAPLSILTPSSIEEGNLPLVTALHQNYPNPFNPTTTIKFDLASNSNVKLNVYNYNGQLVKSLVNGAMNAGFHAVNFDASSLSAGVYYYTMETAGKAMTQKMVLVK